MSHHRLCAFSARSLAVDEALDARATPAPSIFEHFQDCERRAVATHAGYATSCMLSIDSYGCVNVFMMNTVYPVRVLFGHPLILLEDF